MVSVKFENLGPLFLQIILFPLGTLNTLGCRVLCLLYFFLYFTLDSSYCCFEVQSSAVNKTDAVPAVMELTCHEQCVTLNARKAVGSSCGQCELSDARQEVGV